MVDFRVTYILPMCSQPLRSPKSRPRYIPDESGQAGTGQAGCTTYQGNFDNSEKVGVTGKCLLISLMHHKSQLIGTNLLAVVRDLISSYSVYPETPS